MSIGEVEALLPVIAMLLQFSPDEVRFLLSWKEIKIWLFWPQFQNSEGYFCVRQTVAPWDAWNAHPQTLWRVIYYICHSKVKFSQLRLQILHTHLQVQKCQQAYHSTLAAAPSPATDGSGSGLSLFSRFSFSWRLE